MSFKFEKLEVWQEALEYADRIDGIAEKLPRSEEYNFQIGSLDPRRFPPMPAGAVAGAVLQRVEDAVRHCLGLY